MKDTYADLFLNLSDALDTFIREVQAKKISLMATDEWTVKDELSHIVFWHETYAANYKALAEHAEPVIPQIAPYKLNMQSVPELRKYSVEELMSRLKKAHDSLYNSIVVKKVPEMTYWKKGRTYKTDEFLSMIARHIATHTKQVKHAKEV